MLAWNRAATRTITDFARIMEADRNILLFALTDPAARPLFGAEWAAIARRMVTQFRATHDLWAGDPSFAGLVDLLRQSSAAFATWWPDHDIRAPLSGRKTLHHPTLGLLRVDHASFQANDNSARRIQLVDATH